MNLKEILNEVLSQSAFLQRDNFASSTDPDAIQMVSFANRAAGEIREFFPWNFLRKSAQITLIDGQLSYDLPSDFDAYVTESMWKAYGARNVVIPTPERQWSFIKAGNPGNAISYYAKLIGGKLEFTAVTGGDIINFDYISNAVVRDAAGELKERFTADTDEYIMNADTLILGTKAFWKLEKEMPSGVVDQKEFRQHLKRDISKDTPSVVIRSRSSREGTPWAPPISENYLW